MMSGAEKASIGQDKVYGLGIEGVYPFARNHHLVFEGGYRVFPTSRTQAASNTTIDSGSDGFFGGVAYRYCFTASSLDGLYLQGGLRHYSLRAEQTTTVPGAAADGGDLRIKLKGVRAASTKPVFCVGFRFTEALSLELHLAGLQTENVQGGSKSGSVVEVALGIHL